MDTLWHKLFLFAFSSSWTAVVQKDCQARELNRVDATDHSRWTKLMQNG